LMCEAPLNFGERYVNRILRKMVVA
jgi:hypothetical protein